MKIFASILKQLAVRVNYTIPELENIYQTFRTRGTVPGINDLVHVLQSAFTIFSVNFIVFDALDECDQSQRTLLFDGIRQFPTENVRIFTTSRPHIRDVQIFFQQASTIVIKADPIDMRNYFSRRIDERISRYPHLKKRIIETLSTNTQEM